MENIKELSRRSFYLGDGWPDYYSFCFLLVIAEIVVDADGQRVFLSTTLDILGQYTYEATAESLFDIYKTKSNFGSHEEYQKYDEEYHRIIKGRIIDNYEFDSYFEELEQMMRDEIKVNASSAYAIIKSGYKRKKFIPWAEFGLDPPDLK